MCKRFWRWLWGPPCEHQWEVERRTIVKYIEKPRIRLSPGEYVYDDQLIKQEYMHVTRFCLKCAKLVQYFE